MWIVGSKQQIREPEVLTDNMNQIAEAAGLYPGQIHDPPTQPLIQEVLT